MLGSMYQHTRNGALYAGNVFEKIITAYLILASVVEIVDGSLLVLLCAL
jgi:hypothetical protein